MNKENEFDRIAREKLAERAFTFQEGDWAAMEQLIAQGRKRRGLGWWYTLAAVALIAPTTWLLLQEPAPETAQVAGVPTAQPATTASNDGPEQRTTTAGTTNEQAAQVTTEQASAPVATTAGDAMTGAEPVAGSQRTKAHRVAPHDEERAESTAAAKGASSARNTRPEPVASASAATSVIGTPTSAEPNNAPTTADEPASTAAEPAAAAIEETDQAPFATAIHADPGANTGDPHPPTQQATSENLPPAADQADAPAGEVATMKAAPQDSATAAAPPTITPKVIRPWAVEISGLGGAWASTPRYAGAGTESWRNDVQGRLAPAVGAEIAFQRGWFSFGSGVHAVSYTEAVQQERIAQSSTNVDTTYGLTPTPATITIIIDTIVQGPATYYVTQTIDTVLNVLTTEYDSTTTVTVLREGIDRVNRVSYVEVPLFLDLHTTAGRWTFGARGGPFMGFRTLQRTVLPGAEGVNDAFADGTFRSTVLGWSARVYARYRVSDRWSIGLEPGMRGSFGDVMDAPGITRRNSAWGAWFSLSYRLP